MAAGSQQVNFEESFHARLLDSLQDGVYFVDRERRILYWNKGAEELTGYSAEEVIGRACHDNLLSHINQQGCQLCLKGCPLAHTIKDGQSRDQDIYLRHKKGHRVPVSVRSAPLYDEAGRITGAVEVFSDATEKQRIKRRVGELETMAFIDPLTSVPNRRYTELKVLQAIQEVEMFKRNVGVVLFDIDHFKLVNDTHGHQVGDEALCSVCRTVKHHLRLGDVLGRWGGEEFVVVVKDINHDRLAQFAERCRTLIAQAALPVSTGELHITVSVGATMLRADDDAQAAVGRADDLMYQSKLKGRNRVTLG